MLKSPVFQTSEYQSTREILLVAQTTREHLELRVSDLALQVAAKDEKLAIYEGRDSNGSADSTRTREQELEVKVADLRCVDFLTIPLSLL